MRTRHRPNGKHDRLLRAYERGRADRRAGRSPDECPFNVPEHREAYERGWDGRALQAETARIGVARMA